MEPWIIITSISLAFSIPVLLSSYYTVILFVSSLRYPRILSNVDPPRENLPLFSIRSQNSVRVVPGRPLQPRTKPDHKVVCTISGPGRYDNEDGIVYFGCSLLLSRRLYTDVVSYSQRGRVLDKRLNSGRCGPLMQDILSRMARRLSKRCEGLW